jgi:hypothetical protein
LFFIKIKTPFGWCPFGGSQRDVAGMGQIQYIDLAIGGILRSIALEIKVNKFQTQFCFITNADLEKHILEIGFDR